MDGTSSELCPMMGFRIKGFGVQVLDQSQLSRHLVQYAEFSGKAFIFKGSISVILVTLRRINFGIKQTVLY